MSGEVAVRTWVRCFLDKVERSWSCWRHPNASGVGVKVAGAMDHSSLTKAQSDFLGWVCVAESGGPYTVVSTDYGVRTALGIFCCCCCRFIMSAAHPWV